MFSPGHAGAGAYARVGIETGVMGASPHRLIAMLYDGARNAVARARLHLSAGEVSARGDAIGKALRIVEDGLRQSLDLNAGGEIAARLDALYTYIARRLLEANATASDALLAEVDGLLATLESAWTGIGPEVARMTTQAHSAAVR